jgi:enoyl-CoA hydratase/carnithine racemase
MSQLQLREWAGVPAAELRPKIEVFAEAVDQLGRFAMPTLAAVQGGCVGGGFKLAMTCDMIIAGRSARFSCPEATVGILTLQGGMLQLAEWLGAARAAELVFLAEPVSAEQLCEWNIVSRVVDDPALEQAARDLVMGLATGPTRAYAATNALWRLQAERGHVPRARSLRALHAALRDAGRQGRAARGRGGGRRRPTVPEDDLRRPVAAPLPDLPVRRRMSSRRRRPRPTEGIPFDRADRRRRGRTD